MKDVGFSPPRIENNDALIPPEEEPAFN